MLKVILDYAKLERARRHNLTNRSFKFQGVQIQPDHGYYYAELPELDSEVPDAIKGLVECFCLEETIAGPGKQWRHGEYKHRDTDDAFAFFDGNGRGDRVLKMRARTQADLKKLREIVLRVKPGDRNQIDGLIEPPLDAWNAGYEAGLKAD